MKKLVIASLALALLSGCASVKRMTGQTNDTILPGQREEILPPDQQTARDPAVTGQQGGMAAGQPISQTPINGAQPAMPGAPKPGAPLAMPSTGAGAGAAANCDPKVDLCPEPMSPDPLPPPSPVKPVKQAAGAAKAGVPLDPKTGKPMAGATAAKPVPVLDPKTGQPMIDPKTGKPVMAVPKLLKKKKIIKKLPAKPVAPATGDAAAPAPAPAAPDATTTPVPAPPQPQAQ